MDYSIQIIQRDQVPSNIYLCGEEDSDKDFKYIHLFEFNNGFKFVIGSNNRIYSINEIIENIEFDFRITTEYNNSPDELQEYYRDEFDIFYKYKICKKIWNHYNNNKQLIQEIIDYYKEEYDNNDSLYEQEIDEGIESDNELAVF